MKKAANEEAKDACPAGACGIDENPPFLIEPLVHFVN